MIRYGYDPERADQADQLTDKTSRVTPPKVIFSHSDVFEVTLSEYAIK
jgi:hypothetical protein